MMPSEANLTSLVQRSEDGSEEELLRSQQPPNYSAIARLPVDDDTEATPLLRVDDEEQAITRRWQKWKKPFGIFIATASGIMFSCCSYFIKAYDVDFVDLSLVRAILQTSYAAICIKYKGQRFWPHHSANEDTRWIYFFLIGQSFVAGWMILARTVSVLKIPLGDALTIIFTAPIFTCILARICYGTSLKFYKLTFIMCLFTGVLLVVQPPFIFPDEGKGYEVHDFTYFMGAMLALSAAVFGGLNNIIISGPLKSIPTFMLLFYVGIGSFFIAIISTEFDDQHRIMSPKIGEISAFDWIMLFSLATFGSFAYYLNIKALQLIEPTIVSVLRALEIALAYGIQVVIMNQDPDPFGVAGAVVVILSVVAIPLEKPFIRRVPDTFAGKRFL